MSAETEQKQQQQQQQQRLRIGFVPEHFSTPLHFARSKFGLDAELRPFPSGTGHMITALRASEIDVGIGLTEGWVAGLGKADVPGDGGYRIVGTYVETPLCWAISTGASRPEITSVASLRGSKIGVSRLGSGSQVMGFVLADQQGWLDGGGNTAPPSPGPFGETVILHDFANLRRAVNSAAADFFMWEHFTSKRYHDAGEIRRLGDIHTPWSSWKIVASTATATAAGLAAPGGPGGQPPVDTRLEDLFAALDRGVAYFLGHPDEAVAYISSELDYSEEDAREWLKTVRFARPTKGVDAKVIEDCVAVLRKAGVLVEGEGMEAKAMTVGPR